MLKFATAEILDARIASPGSPMMRTAHRATFHYEPKHGMLYVRSRMISSRTNDNFDEFPADDIREGWPTFLGKPVFVNHHNEDHRRMRGLIIDAVLHEDRTPVGTPDIWVEGLMEIDALRYPKLAKAIIDGDIDRTSMGVDVAFSVCAACGNKATTPLEYCAHIPGMKGRTFVGFRQGQRMETLIRERCHGLRFFENSLLVEEPADPTAYFLGDVVLGPGLDHLNMKRTASRHYPTTPGRDGQVIAMQAGEPVWVDASPGPVQITLPQHTSTLRLAHGGTCPACRGLDTISMQGMAECFGCEYLYELGAPPLHVEAAPRYADPGQHPFFQANPTHADNIMKVWHAGTEDEHEQGRRWYADAGLVAKGLGTLHRGTHPGGNTHLAAGLIANYSPQTGWAANQHNAARVLHEGRGIGGPGSGIFASSQQRKAADRMLGGEMHTSVLTSPKVSDFAHLVEHGGDQDEEDPHTVVDRHALSVATGRRMSNDDYNAFPKTQRHYYDHVVGAYHAAANMITRQSGLHVPAHAVQAATWLTQQRLNQRGEAANVGTNNERLDKGRHRNRQQQEDSWSQFRRQHLPDMQANPGTGYSNVASRRGRH